MVTPFFLLSVRYFRNLGLMVILVAVYRVYRIVGYTSIHFLAWMIGAVSKNFGLAF